MSSTSDAVEPTSPGQFVPDFKDWSVRATPLDVTVHGERAVFWDNFHGLPTIVQRKEYNDHRDGCIVYTKDPIPVDTAWRITLLKTADSGWDTGLVSWITSYIYW